MVKRVTSHLLAFLLLLTASFARGQDLECQTPACEGHKAGYNWAMNHELTEQDCDTAGEHTNSSSFAEGCRVGLQTKRNQFAAMIQELRPLIQQYLAGKEAAKELRALPSDCEMGYKNALAARADESEATSFRNGCLEVARKQAKKIIKENEKRAKEVEKQSRRQAREEARNATDTP